MDEDKKKAGRPYLGFTESQLLYAMAMTNSCGEAAKFLNIDYSTFKRYAKQYIDADTGLNFLEVQKEKNRRWRAYRKKVTYLKRKNSMWVEPTPLVEILEGKHPQYDRHRLKKRLISNAVLKPKCSLCGFDERRIIDGRVPILLVAKDGDLRNYKLDNLCFKCYNCYFLTENNIFGVRHKKDFLKD